MSYEQKDNSGALFKNDKKEKESQPDYRGPCMVNGQEMEMSAWLKKSKNNTNYMSIAFKEPWEKKAAAPEVKHPPDEVPF